MTSPYLKSEIVALALIVALSPMNSISMYAEEFDSVSAAQVSPCFSFMPMAAFPVLLSPKKRDTAMDPQSRSSICNVHERGREWLTDVLVEPRAFLDAGRDRQKNKGKAKSIKLSRC